MVWMQWRWVLPIISSRILQVICDVQTFSLTERMEEVSHSYPTRKTHKHPGKGMIHWSWNILANKMFSFHLLVTFFLLLSLFDIFLIHSHRFILSLRFSFTLPDERTLDRKPTISNYVDPSDGVRHVSWEISTCTQWSFFIDLTLLLLLAFLRFSFLSCFSIHPSFFAARYFQHLNFSHIFRLYSFFLPARLFTSLHSFTHIKLRWCQRPFIVFLFGEK